MNVAIIPARGGSKRIPKKNIKTFYGKPMLHYPLKQACDSGLFDKVVVSSDDDEILEVASTFSASIECYKRSKNLSDDFTPTIPVIQDYIRSASIHIDDICCIYPCTPFLTKETLNKFYIEYAKDKNYFYFPVVEFSSSIYRSLSLNSKNVVSPIFKENTNTRTQDLSKAFYDAGQFYIGSRDKWLKEEKIHSSAKALSVSKLIAVDIDEIEDWYLAENIYKNNAL